MQNETEKEIQNRLSHIVPPRRLFDNVMKSVTNSEAERSNKMRESIPSTGLRSQFFLKKFLSFGVPVAVIAVALMLVISPDRKEVALIENQSIEEVIDSIITEMIEESSAESLIAASESEEEMAINDQLQTYNDIKNYSYENTI